MDQAQQIIEKAQSFKAQIIEAQRELVAIPALGPDNGGDGEMAKARLVQSWLEDLGLQIQRIDAPDDRVPGGLRPNIAAVLPGSGNGPRVWVLSHLDVVPPGELSLWGGDPWTLRVDGDRLYGRGVNDNHAGLVASYFGLKAIAELGITPPGDVGLLMVADEETGSAYGLDHVVDARPDLFSPDDIIVVPDSGREDGSMIEVAEKSMLWLKVVVTGKQVHASVPQKGKNALYAAARMMVAVREVAARFPGNDELFSPPFSTMEPTRKEVGVENINTVPGRDVFYVDCRVLPPVPLDEVIAAFGEVFGAIAKEEGVGVEISIVQKLQAPPATSEDSPVVKALQKCIGKVLGVEAKPAGIGGGTVAAFFRKKGLPAAVWQTAEETAHMPDEWTSLNALVKDSAIFGLLYSGF